MDKLISVVIPSFNRSQTISRALYSVLNQTYKNFEIIVVDDCSVDNTLEVVESINDDRIRIIKHKKNKGANAARNSGISEARGDFIAFQDSDDEWFPEKLEKQLEHMSLKNADVVACAYNQHIDNRVVQVPEKNIDNSNVFNQLLYGNFIATPSILGKREVFTSVLFDEALPRFQDWEIMIRIAKQYKVSFINKVLLNAYVLDNGITANWAKGIKAFKIIIKKYSQDYSKNRNAKKTIYRAMNYFAIKGKDFKVNYCKKGLKECGFDLKTFARFCEFGVKRIIS